MVFYHKTFYSILKTDICSDIYLIFLQISPFGTFVKIKTALLIPPMSQENFKKNSSGRGTSKNSYVYFCFSFA